MVLGIDVSSLSSEKLVGCKSNSNTNSNFSVLIVDDDPIIRRIHKALLNKYGMKTSVAENGKEAVDLYLSGAHFDIVFMDMDMPIMDGPQATRELRAMGIKSKIVGVTARGKESEKEDFISAGLNCCHEKPLTSSKISSILQEIVQNFPN